MRSLADDLIERGQLVAGDAEHFVSSVHDAARRGRFAMTLTMFAEIGTLPPP